MERGRASPMNSWRRCGCRNDRGATVAASVPWGLRVSDEGPMSRPDFAEILPSAEFSPSTLAWSSPQHHLGLYYPPKRRSANLASHGEVVSVWRPCLVLHTTPVPHRWRRAAAADGVLRGPQGMLKARVAAQAVSPRGAPERRTSLKIMVSPVRIRVPPVVKVLQIARK